MFHAFLASSAREGLGLASRGRRLRGALGLVFALGAWVVLAPLAAPVNAQESAGSAAGSKIPRTKAPEGAGVYIVAPKAGETVSSPVKVVFGLEGMGVAPAGVDKAATGHHHLIVDAELPPLDLPIPNSEHYRHFGKGQTEVELELPPGQHTLQLLVGDHNHIPHDPPVVSERITIIVE